MDESTMINFANSLEIHAKQIRRAKTISEIENITFSLKQDLTRFNKLKRGAK